MAHSQPRHMAARHGRRRLVALLIVAAAVVGGVLGVQRYVLDESTTASRGDPPADDNAPGTTTSAEQNAETAQPEEPDPDALAPSGFATPGLLTFRGGPHRDYYGEGPVPQDPEILWSHPADGNPMCHTSARDGNSWCGTGWTGQPAVFERDGRTWVVFGAYDRRVHFLDYHTGENILPPFEIADIIKGSVSVDPDGFPLVYVGGALEDTKLHVVAIDRAQPQELWSLDAHDVSPTMWWDNWDGSSLVVDDYLFEGGENSVFHVVKLNREYDDDGLVQVSPELVFSAPGWDQELLDGLVGSARDAQNVSIENSVAYHDGIVYFSNGGGLVQGWDVSGLDEGVEPTRVFRFWAGDDTDATITMDDEGFLYVPVEWQHQLPRGREVGHVLKLDPNKPNDPVVWAFHDPAAGGCCGEAHEAGLWATLGLHEDLIIAPTHTGTIYGLDRMTGEVRWEIDRGAKTWSSPVIVDDVWIQGSCDNTLSAYDVSDTSVQPPELWSVQVDGCIESTPALWQGRLFVGARGGFFYAIGDR